MCASEMGMVFEEDGITRKGNSKSCVAPFAREGRYAEM